MKEAHMINERINSLRKILHLSQEEFGKKIGMKKSAVSKIEKGINNMSDASIMLLCHEFNVNEEWLRDGRGEMFRKPTDLFTLLGYKSNSMDAETEIVIRNFLLLPDDDRKKFMEFFKKIVSDLDHET
jgi:transcriptional regulator with XRE-family HTH domain